ncbi:MAG: hypothetical protein Q4A69_06705 [Moraxella sp.]|nr:hypothetical protein [Moraxella sp.]
MTQANWHCLPNPILPKLQTSLADYKKVWQKVPALPIKLCVALGFWWVVFGQKRRDGAVALMWLDVKANTGTALKHQPRAVLQ